MTPPPNGAQSPAVAADLIRFSCWSCSTELTVPAHMAGVTGPCPVCGQTLAAPMALATRPGTGNYSPASLSLQTSAIAQSYQQQQQNAAYPGLLRDPMPMPSSAAGASLSAPPPLPGSSSPSSPASPSSSEGGGGTGYRRPPPPMTAPPPSKSKSGADAVKWETLVAIPFILMAATWQGKVLGGVLGALVWKFATSLLSNTESGLKRMGGLLVCMAGGLWVFVIACEVLELPLKIPGSHGAMAGGGSGGAGSFFGGSLDNQLAMLRAEVKKRKPGMFTEEDFRAADVAVTSSGKRDMVTMAYIYGQVLQRRAQDR